MNPVKAENIKPKLKKKSPWKKACPQLTPEIYLEVSILTVKKIEIELVQGPIRVERW